MKKLRLKGIVLALLTAILWSCQTEELVISETKSRVAPPDGVPSDYDDYLRLTTTDYYHLGKKITDTTEIKKLLLHAKVTLSEENRTDIYVTEDEARSLLDDHEKRKSEMQNKAAAPDADDFLIYFYETSFKFWNDLSIGGKIYYHKYQTIRGPIDNYYTKVINPFLYYGPTKKSAIVPANGKTLSKMTEPHHPSEQFFSNLNFVINVFNPTRFTRRVVFEDQFGSIKFRVIPPKKSAAIGGFVNYSGYRVDGTSFRIKKHYSYKN